LHKTFYSAADRSHATWHAAVNPTTSLCDGLLTATGRMTMPTLMRKYALRLCIAYDERMADLVVRLFISVDTVLLAEDKASIRAMKLVWERASLDCVAPPPSYPPHADTSLVDPAAGMKLVIEPSSALSLAVMLEPTAPAAAQAQPSAEPWIDLVKEIVAARAAREPAQASEAGEAGELVVRVLVVITGGNVEWGKVAKWFAEAEADEEAEQEKPAQ
jgi:hypothetical protein